MRPAGRKRKGRAPPGRHRFTREECRRGYRVALAKCSESWELSAWFYYRVRGFYRRKRRLSREQSPVEKGDDPCA